MSFLPERQSDGIPTAMLVSILFFELPAVEEEKNVVNCCQMLLPTQNRVERPDALLVPARSCHWTSIIGLDL